MQKDAVSQLPCIYIGVTVSITTGYESPYLAMQHEAVTLTCAPVNFPAGIERYQWLFRNEMLAAEYEAVESESSSSLTISSVSYLDHLGDYYCRVTSDGQTYTSNVYGLLASERN